MNSSVLSASSSSLPSSAPLPSSHHSLDNVPAHHASPVVAFIIGLGIVTLASIMNAAGLNLTKLDHVRTSAIPKASRRKDWLRPLWLLGMVLYVLSQLIGSTLALEYMRAEYVAPLGSTSLIFNFLFAKFLVNSPVTNNDIYGTIIVIIGVIGIVAFGSINSGFNTETDAHHLTHLWNRGNWLAYFFLLSFALIALSIFISQLDAVLASRADLSAVPFDMESPTKGPPPKNILRRVANMYTRAMHIIRGYLESWTSSHDDKRIAWTLGIGWACLGGALAGGCLVFAKAGVALISGAASHMNTGNQFGQASSIFTFLLLAVTAVSQIICLNRGLKVYDSTLVVPVFYGVYTAMGFLNSLIFNNEVDAYQSWTLFLIFCSILILISGVVLLTNKKPDPQPKTPGFRSTDDTTTTVSLPPNTRRRARSRVGDEEEGILSAEGGSTAPWQLGDASDDEDGSFPSTQRHAADRPWAGAGGKGERARMMEDHDSADEAPRGSTSSDATLARPEQDGDAYSDEFGDWKTGKAGI
ncbi:uncharacterized protein PHACADRAFT_257763 [Phanerochaete carnosa HHB-10118-sp]|uniref:Uncharacterized protein n=1 Tax=Phanerochaete carnosa (strain HHB-10118-sp) TaxID=650164 RepID=K5UVS3_PHACS|nr:uncharacterized protein PHACADRAFT_257763 [Phanerochaete carnosa HHB-10118-sp]EKM54136.1 hypothetical protein PHACADRAFT_257763 [Phanerochaete carnosa HHB-10118-sp]